MRLLEAGPVPSDLPEHISAHGIRLGRIIIQEGVVAPIEIIMEGPDDPAAVAASVHNNLGGIQGGAAAEYYHFSAAEHASLSVLADDDGGSLTNLTDVVMESDFNVNTILAATVDDTPAALSVGEETVVGCRTGGAIATIPIGVESNNLVQVSDGQMPAVKKVAMWTAMGLGDVDESELKLLYNIADWADPEYPMYMRLVVNMADVWFQGTDCEIKIFNVTNTTEEWSDANMVYYWQSQGDPWEGNNRDFGDTNCRAYFVDDLNAFPLESRGILKQSLYTNQSSLVDVNSIYSQLNRAGHADARLGKLMVFPSHEGCLVDWTTWQMYTNSHNLRASYILYDSVGPNTNAVGGQRWQALPIDWIRKRQNEAPLPQG